MRVALLAILLSGCGDPEPSSAPRERPRHEEAPHEEEGERAEGPALAYHLGVTLDGAEVLAEAMLPRSARVSIGSAPDATLRLPPELGIERRVVIEAGALRFTGEDRVALYREEAPLPQPAASSPLPIREPVILYVDRVHVLVDPVVAERSELGRVRTPWTNAPGADDTASRASAPEDGDRARRR